MPVVDLSKIGLEGMESYQTRTLQAAQSEQLRANTTAQDIENETNERMNQLNNLASQRLQQTLRGERSGPDGDPDEAAANMSSLADPLEDMAQVYALGGAPEKASELWDKASQIRKRESDIEGDKSLQQQRRLENIIKGGDIVGRKLGGAKNEDEWQQGLKEVEAAGLIEPDLMARLKAFKYDPDVAAYFRSQAISAKESADLELRQLTQDALQRQREVQNDQQERRISLQELRDIERARANKVKEKNAGDKATAYGAPNPAESLSVKNVLLNTVYKGIQVKKNDPDFNAAISYVASEAKTLVRENKSLSWDTAVRRAIMTASESGAFGTQVSGKTTIDKILGKTIGVNTGGVTSPKFKADGLKPDTAVPQPKTLAEMKKGRYYITSRGRARWNGSSFELVE